MDLEEEKKLNLINVIFTIALQTGTIDIQVKIAVDKYAKSVNIEMLLFFASSELRTVSFLYTE